MKAYTRCNLLMLVMLLPRGYERRIIFRAAVGNGYGYFHGDSHGYGYGMGTVMNPHGPVGILWGIFN